MSATNTRVPLTERVFTDNHDENPVREVLDRVGGKWSVLIVVMLGRRTHRYLSCPRVLRRSRRW